MSGATWRRLQGSRHEQTGEAPEASLARRLRVGRAELGQTALAIVMALVLVMVSLPVALDLMAVNRTAVAGHAQDAQSALLAADAGLADFQNHLVADPSYASAIVGQGFCSGGSPTAAFPPVVLPTPSGCASGPDPNDPAFVANFAASCPLSSGAATGWDTTSGTATTYNTGFQFIVDAQQVATNQVVYVYATGRAGYSGQYDCRSVKAAYQILSASGTPVPSPTPVTKAQTPPGVAAHVSLTIGGGTGSVGGTSLLGGFICLISQFLQFIFHSTFDCTTGSGGVGMQVSAGFTAPANTFFSTAKGKAGSIGTGGGGFTNASGWGGGGGGIDGGGGGGATVVCSVSASGTPCAATMPACSAATAWSTTNCILAVAAGGGGGGGVSFCSFSNSRAGGGGYSSLSGASGAGGAAGGGGGQAGGTGGVAGSGAPGGSAGAGTATGLGGAGGTRSGSSSLLDLFLGSGDGGGGGGGYAGGGGGGAAGGFCGNGGGGGEGSSWSSPWIGAATVASATAGDGYATVITTSAHSTQLTWSADPNSNCGTWVYDNLTTTISPTPVVFQLIGAGGGSGNPKTATSAVGGQGAIVNVTIDADLTAGNTIWAKTGCGGGADKANTPAQGGTGYTNGGAGGASTLAATVGTDGGGAGGGSTVICIGPTAAPAPTTLCNSPLYPVVVAAGGGGGGGQTNLTGTSPSIPAPGGSAGNTTASVANPRTGCGFRNVVASNYYEVDGTSGGKAQSGANPGVFGGANSNSATPSTCPSTSAGPLSEGAGGTAAHTSGSGYNGSAASAGNGGNGGSEAGTCNNVGGGGGGGGAQDPTTNPAGLIHGGGGGGAADFSSGCSTASGGGGGAGSSYIDTSSLFSPTGISVSPEGGTALNCANQNTQCMSAGSNYGTGGATNTTNAYGGGPGAINSNYTASTGTPATVGYCTDDTGVANVNLAANQGAQVTFLPVGTAPLRSLGTVRFTLVGGSGESAYPYPGVSSAGETVTVTLNLGNLGSVNGQQFILVGGCNANGALGGPGIATGGSSSPATCNIGGGSYPTCATESPPWATSTGQGGGGGGATGLCYQPNGGSTACVLGTTPTCTAPWSSSASTCVLAVAGGGGGAGAAQVTAADGSQVTDCLIAAGLNGGGGAVAGGGLGPSLPVSSGTAWPGNPNSNSTSLGGTVLATSPPMQTGPTNTASDDATGPLSVTTPPVVGGAGGGGGFNDGSPGTVLGCGGGEGSSWWYGSAATDGVTQTIPNAQPGVTVTPLGSSMLAQRTETLNGKTW